MKNNEKEKICTCCCMPCLIEGHEGNRGWSVLLDQETLERYRKASPNID